MHRQSSTNGSVLPADGILTDAHLRCQEQRVNATDRVGHTPITWKSKGKSLYYALQQALPPAIARQLEMHLEQWLDNQGQPEMDEHHILQLVQEHLPPPHQRTALFFARLVQAKGQ
jgi:hypothetical protein